MSASIYNYRAEMSVNLFSFVPQHLKEIAVRMAKAEKGGFYALGGMTAGRWYRDKSGEEFKFIGKIDSGENKGKFLFTDGQKSVYKDLEDFEGGRPKETKLFGFFEDGGMMAKGGRIGKDWNGRKSKETWGKSDLYEIYDNNLDLVADVHDYYKKMGSDITEDYAKEMKKDMIDVLQNGKIKFNDGATTTFEKGGYMAKGGAIKNQYEGKTASEVWSKWTEQQRSHFLLDHSELLDKDRMENNLGYSRTIQKDKIFTELTPHTQRVLESHVNSGQYAKGGETKNTKTWKVVGRTIQGKLFEKEITLGRMSDRNDVMNALKRMPDTQIREITFIGERFKAADGGMMAKGGLVEHGLERGDTIELENLTEDGDIEVKNKFDGKKYSVNLNNGIRKEMVRKLPPYMMADGGEIVTDKADVQKIKNSIQEGELILRAGRSYGRKLSAAELESIRKSVNNSRKKIGLGETQYASGGYMAKGGSVDFDYELKIQPDFKYKNIAKGWLEDNAKDSTKYKLAVLLLRGKRNPDEILGINEVDRYARLLRSLESAKGGSKHETEWRTENYTLNDAQKWTIESLGDMFYLHANTTKMAKGGKVRSPKEFNELVEEKEKIVKNLSPKEIAEMWNKNVGKMSQITEDEAGKSNMKMYLSNLLVEKELTEEEYNKYFEKGGYMAKGGVTKESIKRTLTSDTNQYFLEKDNDGYILYISPKGAMNSTFHDKFNVEDLGTDGTRMKYKLTKLEKGGHMAEGGVADNWKKGTTTQFKTRKDAQRRLDLMKNNNESGTSFQNLKVEKVSDGWVVKFDFKDKMADGGKVKFADKVKSVQESLLKRKKVAPQVQKDYGKTYSKAEAKESAQRIVGSRMAQLKEKMAKKKK
jgi:hypothetical protein